MSTRISTMTHAELYAQRCAANVSQARLAREMGVNVATISRWERGVRPISKPMATAIQAALAPRRPRRKSG